MNITTRITCLFIVAFAMARGYISTSLESQDIERRNKAKEILRYMNESADPCEDFYEFSCGNYGKDERSNYAANPLEILEMDMRMKLKTLLEKDNTTDSHADRQVKNFYRSCMNAKKLENIQSLKLRELIEEIGKMPLLSADNWQEEKFQWSKMVTQIIYKFGFEPKFPLETRSIYLDPQFEDDRQNNIRNIVRILEIIFNTESDEEEEEEAKLCWNVAKEILDFETALAQGMLDDKENLPQNELLALTLVTQLKTVFNTTLDFEQMIEDAMDYKPAQVYIQKHYVQNVLDVIAKTPAKTLANYIFYNYISKFIVPTSMASAGQSNLCLDSTKEFFYKKLDQLLYRETFSAELEISIQRMWLLMKMTFRETILSSRLQWMTENTREKALKKLNKMRLDISSYSSHNFSQEYADLNLNPEDYIANMKAIFTWNAKKSRHNLKQSIRSIDYGALSSYGPMYSNVENAIKLPIGFLQPNYFWSPLYPKTYNFGALGSAIGHEIVHAFDDKGSRFDADGNEHNWWDNESEKEFAERKRCFVYQYQGLTNQSHSSLANEQQFQGENIADNGGLRLAFSSYMKWLHRFTHENSKEIQVLPNFNYTNEQLFFISYGQNWCSTLDTEFDAYQQAMGNYAPAKFRTIGPLLNYEEFSKAFHCPRGSLMNPLRKCEIY
ncbi:neprilysin-11-like [Haematobia irritans]|uniref:neprilysin-11-like n=1 Tax=Haematobia irritans TaxID=7368 RepID=UPI003F4FAEBF